MEEMDSQHEVDAELAPPAVGPPGHSIQGNEHLSQEAKRGAVRSPRLRLESAGLWLQHNPS